MEELRELKGEVKLIRRCLEEVLELLRRKDRNSESEKEGKRKEEESGEEKRSRGESGGRRRVE